MRELDAQTHRQIIESTLTTLIDKGLVDTTLYDSKQGQILIKIALVDCKHRGHIIVFHVVNDITYTACRSDQEWDVINLTDPNYDKYIWELMVHRLNNHLKRPMFQTGLRCVDWHTPACVERINQIMGILKEAINERDS